MGRITLISAISVCRLEDVQAHTLTQVSMLIHVRTVYRIFYTHKLTKLSALPWQLQKYSRNPADPRQYGYITIAPSSLVSYLSPPLCFLSTWLSCISTALHCTFHKTPQNTRRTFVTGDKQLFYWKRKAQHSSFYKNKKSEISSPTNLNQNLHRAKTNVALN